MIDLLALGGADSITSSGVADRTHLNIDAGADADSITTGSGADRIAGGSEADTIDAGAGDDRVFAGPGPDQVFGREGDDGIEGGEGIDGVNGGPNSDGCTDGADIVSECESSTLPADIEARPFPHPLEPEEPVTEPGPIDPTDPVEEDPIVEQPATAGFAIDRLSADRRGLRVALANTTDTAVEVEVGASESLKRKGRRGKRSFEYAGVSRELAAGEDMIVRLKASRKAKRLLASASKRRTIATVTNVTNGLSETEEIRSNR